MKKSLFRVNVGGLLQDIFQGTVVAMILW